MIAILTDHQIR